MTPEEAARFVLSDCQDPELKAKANREVDAMFAEAMKDPVFKAKWQSAVRSIADAWLADAAADIFAKLKPE